MAAGRSAYADLAAGRIRSGLAAAADPVRGAGMQAYLKSALPCYGVRVPVQRRLVRGVATKHPPPDRASWEAAVRALWDEAAFREERQAAITLTGVRAARGWQDPAALPLYRYLVTSGAWWDLVDEVAVQRVGPLLRAWPSDLRPAVLAWAQDPDLWVRRAAVICQVGAGDEVDLALLEETVRANVDDRSFWLRKAVGWALRDAARTHPDWVWALVDDLGDRLSGLSRREATKRR